MQNWVFQNNSYIRLYINIKAPKKHSFRGIKKDNSNIILTLP
jgi:hypothetical protein